MAGTWTLPKPTAPGFRTQWSADSWCLIKERIKWETVIGKKWIYSDTERSALHRQSVGQRRGQMRLQNLVWLDFIGWVISYANEWEDYSNYFWEEVEIARIWATAHSLVFWQCFGTVRAPLGVSFHLLIEDQGLVLSAIWVPFDSNWFSLCSWAVSFFHKLCPAPFLPVVFPRFNYWE